jgi:hypothetical protein
MAGKEGALGPSPTCKGGWLIHWDLLLYYTNRPRHEFHFDRRIRGYSQGSVTWVCSLRKYTPCIFDFADQGSRGKSCSFATPSDRYYIATKNDSFCYTFVRD